MHVSAVVFDLDQTLFDHEQSVRSGLDAWLRGLGAGPTDELIEAWFAAEERHMTAWRAGECSWAEQRRRRLRDILPLIGHNAVEGSELDAIFNTYLTSYEAAWSAFDDAAPCVQALAQRGYRLAVLTNGAERQQRDKLAKIGLDHLFDPVLTTEALGFGKPDPRAYAAVCEALQLPASQCVYVGDNLELDVLAPREFGMHAVHLDRSRLSDASRLRISSLEELPALLRPAT